MAFDAVGNATSLTDSVGNKTSWTYDAIHRVLSEIDPLGATSTYAYDAASQLTSATDRLGRVKNFGYDARGSNTTETWVVSGATVERITFAYDDVGNQTLAANSAGAYTEVRPQSETSQGQVYCMVGEAAFSARHCCSNSAGVR